MGFPHPDWFFQVSTLLQRAACESAFTGDVKDALLRIVPNIPVPTHRAEALALSGLLVEAALGIRATDRQATADLVQKLTLVASGRLSLSVAHRAADYMARRSEERLHLPRLARAFGCSTNRLRREFKLEFGVSLREYDQRLRVRHALTLSAEEDAKASAVARLVGYRSESHFYKAIRRLTGRSPAALVTHSKDQLARIGDGLLPRRPIRLS